MTTPTGTRLGLGTFASALPRVRDVRPSQIRMHDMQPTPTSPSSSRQQPLQVPPQSGPEANATAMDLQDAETEAGWYAQFDEDRILRSMMPQREGLFVEVGAADGVVGSNTLHFEQTGWTGVLVEASPTAASTVPRITDE